MQTFLPYSSYYLSALCLDNKRLGKQRVEADQILNAILIGPTNTITGKKTPWYNHPVVRMWENSEYHLCLYGIEMCKEWKRRGFRDSLLCRFESFIESMNRRKLVRYYDSYLFTPPPWLSDSYIQTTHRSNLLRKDPVFYSQYNWDVCPNLEYYWPM